MLFAVLAVPHQVVQLFNIHTSLDVLIVFFNDVVIFSHNMLMNQHSKKSPTLTMTYIYLCLMSYSTKLGANSHASQMMTQQGDATRVFFFFLIKMKCVCWVRYNKTWSKPFSSTIITVTFSVVLLIMKCLQN